MLRQVEARSGRTFKLFRKNAEGATVLEFAILAPLFFFMLFALFETGLMLFTEYVLQSSVQEAARLVRTGQVQSVGMSEATFKEKVCRLARGIVDCDGKVNIYLNNAVDFETLNATAPAATSIGNLLPDGTKPPTTFCAGMPGRAVALIATYDWDFVVPWVMHFYGNVNGGNTRRLTALAMFRNEPFPAPPGPTC